MSNLVPEVYAPVYIAPPDLATVFHTLAGLMGNAIEDGREFTGALQFDCTVERGRKQQRWHGGFSLQTAGEDPSRPGVQFQVDEDGNGLYAERAERIGRTDIKELFGRVALADDTPRNLQASRVVRQAQKVVQAASTQPAIPTPWGATVERPPLTNVPSQAFIHSLGKVLALATRGAQFRRVEVSIDTTRQRLIGSAGVLHQIIGEVIGRKNTVEFKLEHTHPARVKHAAPQLVSLACGVTVSPRNQSVRFYDCLQGLPSDSPPGWEPYRVRWIAFRGNPTEKRVVSKDPSTEKDIPDMARSLVDARGYLTDHWMGGHTAP